MISNETFGARNRGGFLVCLFLFLFFVFSSFCCNPFAVRKSSQKNKSNCRAQRTKASQRNSSHAHWGILVNKKFYWKNTQPKGRQLKRNNSKSVIAAGIVCRRWLSSPLRTKLKHKRIGIGRAGSIYVQWLAGWVGGSTPVWFYLWGSSCGRRPSGGWWVCRVYVPEWSRWAPCRTARWCTSSSCCVAVARSRSATP